MEKDTLHTRLTALDGLRGFAILLVFLSHINTSFVQKIVPLWLFGWIFTNGVTGVTFLFILSGFLMSTIYPNPQSTTTFLQKRYTRIFPLFLTLCAVMFTREVFDIKSALYSLEILFGYALFTYVVWVFIIQKLPKLYGMLIFFLFLILQALTGLLYIFWINKLSFAEFSHLPVFIHQGFIYLINATLTIPLGQYVPMIDGVYWTLVAEILFYILYPIIVVPLVTFLAHKSLKMKLLFLLCLIPLFGGFHMLSYKIFVLSLIQPALFFYFATGVFLGYLYRNHTIYFENFSKKLFPNYFAVVPFLLFWIFVAGITDLSFLGQTISPWIRMLFAIPLTFMTAILLDKKTAFSKFFSSKILAYIGTVSYSIYLSHSLIIHIAQHIFAPTNAASEFFYILVVFICNIIVAIFLFFLLERPYFHKKEKRKASIHVEPKRLPAKFIFVGISVLYLLGTFTAFQSRNGYNFFSYDQSVSPKNILEPHIHGDQQIITLRNNTHFRILLTPTADNLGLLSLKVRHTQQKHVLYQSLLFTLLDKGTSQVITVVPYNLDEFNKGFAFPFGFPQQSNSKGKSYIADFSLSNPHSQDFVSIDTESIKEVFAANKKNLLTHPSLLFSFVEGKVATIATNPESQFVLLLLIPFLLFSIVV